MAQSDEGFGQLLRSPEGFRVAVPGGAHLNEQTAIRQILVEPLTS